MSLIPDTVANRAQRIIKAVLIDHKMHPDDFFGAARMTYLVAARRDAANRMLKDGIAPPAIARAMRRDVSTVCNYFSKRANYQKERHVYGVITRLLPPDLRDVVIAAAKARGIKTEAVLAEWVADRARFEAEANRKRVA